MAGSGSPQPNRPNPPKKASAPVRRPLQVMHISKKVEQDHLKSEDAEVKSRSKSSTEPKTIQEKTNKINSLVDERPQDPSSNRADTSRDISTDLDGLEGLTMADLLDKTDKSSKNLIN